MTIHDAIRDLERAARTLQEEQGRIARANARTRVKQAARRVLAAMDATFPIIRKERVVRVSMTPLAKKRRQRARRVNLTLVTIEEALKLAGLGVKTEPYTGGGTTGPRHEAPSWAVRALRGGIAPETIKRAVRSAAIRDRIEGLLRLRQPTSP